MANDIKRSLTDVLEEFRPGVHKRNYPSWGNETGRVCRKCGLRWIECRCDGFVPAQMTKDENE